MHLTNIAKMAFAGRLGCSQLARGCLAGGYKKSGHFVILSLRLIVLPSTKSAFRHASRTGFQPFVPLPAAIPSSASPNAPNEAVGGGPGIRLRFLLAGRVDHGQNARADRFPLGVFP